MRGSLVVARDYSGRPLLRRVWDWGSKVIYLSEESQFQRLMAGLDALRPVAFPVEDVFSYVPNLGTNLSEPMDWSSLHLFAAPSRQDGCTKNGAAVSNESMVIV
jgi:hypothetical protein